MDIRFEQGLIGEKHRQIELVNPPQLLFVCFLYPLSGVDRADWLLPCGGSRRSLGGKLEVLTVQPMVRHFLVTVPA